MTLKHKGWLVKSNGCYDGLSRGGNAARCKDGVVKGRQRYLCKECRYRYTVNRRAGTSDPAVRRQALQLYLEGLGLRSIGRILKFSHVAVLKWIRTFGQPLEAIKREEPIEVMELDEMHSYIGSKKLLLDMDGC